LDALVARLAAFHAAAAAGPEVARHANPDALHARWQETLGLAAPLVGRVVGGAEHALLADFGPRFIAGHDALLRARQRAGRIREGHGDLHAEHVYFLEAPAAAAPVAPIASPDGSATSVAPPAP